MWVYTEFMISFVLHFSILQAIEIGVEVHRIIYLMQYMKIYNLYEQFSNKYMLNIDLFFQNGV